MCECNPPVAFFSAGARISASSAGPSSGTAIWRGFDAVSMARRRASVSTAPNLRLRLVARRGRGIASVTADMALSPYRSGSVGELSAGQLQIDVVEGWDAGRDLRRMNVQPGED